MVDKVILLSFWPSMFGIRTKIALEEKGVKYEYIEEDVFEKKSSLLLEMNPIHKKVPVLIHNGKPVCEPIAQIEYIDKVWPNNNPLLSSDPDQRPLAFYWAGFIYELYICGARIWGREGEEQEAATKRFMQILKTLQSELGDKPYFGGESFGFVDIALIAFYSWFPAYQKIGNFKIEPECSKLMAWGKRCMQRVSVAKSLPDFEKVVGFIFDLKNRVEIRNQKKITMGLSKL